MKSSQSNLLLNAKMVFSTALLFICVNTFAQKVKSDDVPTVVKSTFSTEFPNAKIKEWQISGDQFVVLYTDDGTSQKTYLSNAGVIRETRIPINKQELPGFITDFTSVEYVGYEFGKSELVQKPATKDMYFLEMKKKGVGTGGVSELMFSSDGKLISRKDPEGFSVVKEEPVKTKEIKSKETSTTQNKGTTSKEKAAKNPNGDPVDSNKNKSNKKSSQFPENIISENSVPPIIKKNFIKKFPKAEEVKWFNKKGDTTYTIKCIFREQKNEIQYNTSGKWKNQKIELDEKTVPPAVQKYIDKTYRKYQFVRGVKTVTFDKKDGFEISIIELKNKKKKLETTILFDKTGKLFKTIDPDYTYDEITDKESATDRKLDSEYNATATDVDDNNVVGKKVSVKELPTDITTYVYSNYPGMKIKTAFIRENDELGTCYEVSVTREGINQQSAELVFDKMGKFLKNASENSDESTSNVKTAPVVYVPSEVVQNAFKVKHPKATKVVWEEGTENDFIAAYTDGTGAHKSYFSAEGVWSKITTTMNPETVSPNIKSYIEKNHKGYKIVGARNIKKSDKKTYYEVDIQSKKGTDAQTLEFNQAGKIAAAAGEKE
jgi:hypothetical protein